MELIKWLGSTIIAMAVIGAGAAAAIAVGSFMLMVQLGGLVFLLVAGLAISIKESLFGPKDE